MMGTLLFLGALVVAAWFWFDSMRAREAAIAHARRSCQQAGVQFLDETVALGWLGPYRSRGTLRLLRVYVFEFTVSGESRHHGFVAVLGRDGVRIRLDMPEAPPPTQ